MSKRPPGTIELRSPEPATPQRVAQTAHLVEQTLRAANVDPVDVTMIVENFQMRTEVRPRTPEAREGLRRVATVLENPTRAIKRSPEARAIALVLSEVSLETFPSGLVFRKAGSRGKELGTLDLATIKALGALALAATATQPLVKGATQAYSKIFRVGRMSNEDKTIKARIELKGKPHDIPIAAELDAGPIYVAAHKGTWMRLWIDMVWERQLDGALKLLDQRSKITKVAQYHPITGKEFLDSAKAIFDVPETAVGELLTDRSGDV